MTSSSPQTPGTGQSAPPPSLDISKNEHTRIRVALREYRGRDFIDVRTFVRSEHGDFTPTPKGITNPPELLPRLIDALQALEQVEA